MRIKRELKIRSIADENILIMQGHVGVDMTKVASFNATAKWLWSELCDKEFSLDDVARLLVSHFDIDMATARADANKWVDQMSTCNALEI